MLIDWCDPKVHIKSINFKTIETFIHLLKNEGPIDLSSLCGRSTVNPTQKAPTASAKEFPWQAFLLIKFPPNSNRTASYCGGALIDYQWILTSARCVDKYAWLKLIFKGFNRLLLFLFFKKIGLLEWVLFWVPMTCRVFTIRAERIMMELISRAT